MKALVRLLALLALGGVAAAKSNSEIHILYVGTFSAEHTRRIDHPDSPTGKAKIPEGIKKKQSTTRIPAVLGTAFGMTIGFLDPPPQTFRIVWRFPAPGLKHPNKSEILRTAVVSWECANSPCLLGYELTEPWETVPGTWELEVHRDGKLLHRQFFEVVKE